MWTQWTLVVLGVWTIAVPFLGLTATGIVWALVITGAAVAILGIWGAQEMNAGQKTGRMVHKMGHR